MPRPISHLTLVTLTAVALATCSVLRAAAQTPPQQTDTPWLTLVSQAPGNVLVGNNPTVTCQISAPFIQEQLLVVLDNTDVTALITVSTGGFAVAPVQALAAGAHTIGVTLSTRDGTARTQEIAFTVRPPKVGRTSSTNDVGVLFEVQGPPPDGETRDTPTANLSTTFSSRTQLKNGAFQATLSGNGQALYTTPDMGRTADWTTYTLNLQYQTPALRVVGDVGDVSISESPMAAQGLSRRGVKVGVGQGAVSLRAFTLKAQRSGTIRTWLDSGLDYDGGDRIQGAAGEFSLFNKQATVKAVYVTGQQRTLSYGSWAAAPMKIGKTAAFSFGANFFEQKLKTAVEYARSFLTETSTEGDRAPREWDTAYSLKAGGQAGRYSYDGVYEYTGAGYGAIGASMGRDRRGYALKGAGQFSWQAVNVSFARSNNNLLHSALLATMITSRGGLAYNVTKFANVPFGVSYQATRVASADEPAGRAPVRRDTGVFSGNVDVVRNALTLGFTGSYTSVRDAYNPATDNATLTLDVAPGYTVGSVSISGNLGLNRLAAGGVDRPRVVTATYSTGLNVTGSAFEAKLSYSLAFTLNATAETFYETMANDKGVDVRVAYQLAPYVWGLAEPTLGLRGNYAGSVDLTGDVRTQTNSLFVFFSTNVPLSFGAAAR